MKNDQSVFPDQYDPLIFFSDADLDNYTTYQSYYLLYNNNQYTQASALLNDSDIDFYGAWILNLIENELYAIESNMSSFVNEKPKIAAYSTTQPQGDFKCWVKKPS